MKRRILAILLMALVLAVSLVGCSQKGETTREPPAGGAEVTAPPEETPEEPAPEDTEAIRIGGLTGPTSIGMVKLMEDNENGGSSNDYAFTVAGSADELTPKLIQGELDIAAVPANLASVLYNKTEGKIQLLAVNTLGVVYIVENGSAVNAISDLAGKTIYCTGKGSIPEYALRYILTQNELDPDADVRIEWKSEPTEVVSLLAKESGAVAMLPQPYVTVAQSQVQGLRVAIDLVSAWDDIGNGSMFMTGVLIVRKEFAASHQEELSAFLKEYEASTKFVNENVKDAAQFVEKYGLFKAAVAEKAIPYCNVTYIAGQEMKDAMQVFLEVLFAQNPASVGGFLPDDEFYYGV